MGQQLSKLKRRFQARQRRASSPSARSEDQSYIGDGSDVDSESTNDDVFDVESTSSSIQTVRVRLPRVSSRSALSDRGSGNSSVHVHLGDLATTDVSYTSEKSVVLMWIVFFRRMSSLYVLHLIFFVRTSSKLVVLRYEVLMKFNRKEHRELLLSSYQLIVFSLQTKYISFHVDLMPKERYSRHRSESLFQLLRKRQLVQIIDRLLFQLLVAGNSDAPSPMLLKQW